MGSKEHSSLDIDSGSIGKTLSGKYTEQLFRMPLVDRTMGLQNDLRLQCECQFQFCRFQMS